MGNRLSWPAFWSTFWWLNWIDWLNWKLLSLLLSSFRNKSEWQHILKCKNWKGNSTQWTIVGLELIPVCRQFLYGRPAVTCPLAERHHHPLVRDGLNSTGRELNPWHSDHESSTITADRLGLHVALWLQGKVRVCEIGLCLWRQFPWSGNCGTVSMNLTFSLCATKPHCFFGSVCRVQMRLWVDRLCFDCVGQSGVSVANVQHSSFFIGRCPRVDSTHQLEAGLFARNLIATSTRTHARTHALRKCSLYTMVWLVCGARRLFASTVFFEPRSSLFLMLMLLGHMNTSSWLTVGHPGSSEGHPESSGLSSLLAGSNLSIWLEALYKVPLPFLLFMWRTTLTVFAPQKLSPSKVEGSWI